MFDAQAHDRLVGSVDAAHARVGSAHLELLSLIAEVDGREAWKDHGARDMAHWLGMRYGISYWKARRWIAAAHVLEELPRVRDALIGRARHRQGRRARAVRDR